MTTPAVLVPTDPLFPRRPDPHYVWETQVVRDLGGTCVLLDHDALVAGDAQGAVRLVPGGVGPLWYRGWMVGVPAYQALAAALAERGGTLLTTPAGYADAHELPGWYGVFEGATPDSRWLSGPGLPSADDLAGLALGLGGSGPAVVKDFVKSRKYEWEEACFVPDLADIDGLCRVVARFVELQDGAPEGGIVLRRYEEFVRDAQGRAVEARVWWVDGVPVLRGPHPDSAPGPAPDADLSEVGPLVRSLGCRFVSTDLARRADGSGWRVVEVGDGQVSDLPRGADAASLFAALMAV
ncbi:ATP-grasp domain-containing protein [Kitasatospora sp. NPDC051914]|uniref:ATP-grasp domain-containing protein n=1 Tax=Kitasatospora sp. NPDC051914 TaxID=3154945 RepID=UPI00341342C6